ncbi:MAG: hypothetical protein WC968_01630 [Bacilli bacterium]
MAKIIIISGDLASGKSVLAKRLSRHYQIPYFSKAKFKEILGEKIEFEGIDQNKRISKSAYDLLTHVAWRFAQVHGSVILEANFHEAQLEQIKKDAEFMNHKLELVYLTGDIDVLFERFLYREHYENRHPVHLTHPLRSLEEFEAYILKLRSEKEIITRKMLDTTNCDHEMIFEKAIKLIGGLD